MEKMCEKCTLYGEPVHTRCLPGYGDTSKRILLCGEGPGRDEDEEGRPFVGRAGKLLQREWLNTFGYPLDDIFRTNIVRCRPPDNRTPYKAEVKCCEPFLHEELEDVKPTLIIAVGNPAMHAFGVPGKITANSGKVFSTDRWTIMPLVHPSYILQNPRQMQLFRKSLELIKNFIEHGHKIDYGEYEIVEVGDYDHLQRAIKDISTSRHCALDIETSGLSIFDVHPRIKCISFSTEPRRGVTIPLEGWEDDDAIALRLKPILEDPNRKKTGHNISFECKWLKGRLGIDLKGVAWDTQIGAFELDKLTSSGLKEQAWHVGLGGYERILDKKVQDMEGTKLFRYCAIDSDATNRLIQLQQETMSTEMLRYTKKIAIPLISVFHGLHMRGMRVDMGLLDEMENLGKELVDDLRAQLRENRYVKKASEGKFGKFNPNSSLHVGYLLYGVLGAEVKHRTKEKNPAVHAEALRELIGDYPELINELLTYRTTNKFYTTNIKGIRRHVASDSRIHTTFSQTSARSGRSATHDPNSQNWPHEPQHILEKVDPKYHKIFSPRTLIIPDDGAEFWGGDYSQQELRVAAGVSKDRAMTAAFTTEGEDIHDTTAKAIFPPGTEITESRRKIAKTVNFGIIYGMSAYELANRIGVKDSVAKEFMQNIMRKYGGYFRWVSETEAFLDSHGYVVSPTGRRRNFPPLEDLDKKDRAAVYREAVNTPIQGCAYDFLAMALIRHTRAFKKRNFRSYCWNTIHDENVFCTWPDERDEFLGAYKEIAENPPGWMSEFLGDIPLKVEWKHSDKSWGDMKDVEG